MASSAARPLQDQKALVTGLTNSKPVLGPLCKRDRWFESGSLQRGVCLCSEFQGCGRGGPRFRGALHLDGRIARWR